MKNYILQNKEKYLSFVSVLALVSLSLLLILGVYFVTFILTELKMSKSYSLAAKTYYLAEAGINEAIWKLKNDATTADGDDAWSEKFVDQPECATWSANFERTNVLFENSYYSVSIQNTACAKGEIVSIAKITLPNQKTTQRVVKTKVFKALNPSSTQSSAIFSGGSSEVITIRSTLLDIYNGNFFSNNNILIRGGSVVNINDNPATPELEGKIFAENNITVQGSVLNSTARCAQNICDGECVICPPDNIDMPMIDFDSPDPNSYKSKAQATGVVYTEDEFDDLLWANPELVLNNLVTYVTGPIELKGGQKLTVNGILVADGSVTIGAVSCWTKSLSQRCGKSGITVNHIPGEASGILTKGSFSIGSFSLSTNIVGLLYALDKIDLIGLTERFEITGGLMGRKISFINVPQGVATYNDDIVKETIGEPIYSPVVTIEHWEETY